MPAGMKNLNPSPGDVVGMAMNFAEADLDTIVPAGDEDNKECDRCEADSKSAAGAAYSPGAPVGRQSQKERPGEEIPDGILYQKIGRKVLLFDTSPPSGRREGDEGDKGKGQYRTRQCLGTQNISY